jgi:hypothetical protein
VEDERPKAEPDSERAKTEAMNGAERTWQRRVLMSSVVIVAIAVVFFLVMIVSTETLEPKRL